MKITAGKYNIARVYSGTCDGATMEMIANIVNNPALRDS